MRRRDLLTAAIATALTPAARATPKPVVVELFTSQGCSSCPPADTLLGKLAQRPDVIALAWHVDYWDRLGWHDRFSTHQATARQQAYARRLSSEVFTPALVVDGAAMLVGSNEPAVEAAIGAAPPLSVTVTLGGTDAVEIGAGPGPLQALRIVYDPAQTTDVGAGENQGARLSEYHIVRAAELLGAWDGQPRRFTLRPTEAGQGVVVLVQSDDLGILGAADLPPA